MNLYIKKCSICNKIFSYSQYPSTEKQSPKVTCSKSCAYSLRSKRLLGRYIPNTYNEKDLSKWKTFHCKYCNKPFSDGQTTKRIFCSISCKSKWQKENLLGRKNPNWKPLDQRKPFRSVNKKLRKDIIRERTNCEYCKSTKSLQIHHKDRNRGNNNSSNILLLCKSCHAKEHEKQGQFKIAKLIRVHPTE